MVEPHLKGHGELLWHDTKRDVRWVKKYLVCYKDTPESVGRIDIFPDESSYEQSQTCAPVWRTTHYFNGDTTCECDDNTVTIRYEINEMVLKFDGSHEATRWAKICNSIIMEVADRGKNAQPRKVDVSDVPLHQNDPQYKVKVKENDASKAAGITGKHLLVVGAEGIGLQALKEGNIKAYWPFSYIRRYGVNQYSMIFECGRRAMTGPGHWELVTTEGNSILQNVKEKQHQYEKQMQETQTPLVHATEEMSNVYSQLTIDAGAVDQEHLYQPLGIAADEMSSVYSQLTLDDRAVDQEHLNQSLGIPDDLSKGQENNQEQEPTYENLDDDYLVLVSSAKKD